MFIIDASVVIKWFIEEEDSIKAILLKDEHIQGKTILIAPDLLIYEVANVLMISKIFITADEKLATALNDPHYLTALSQL